MFRGKNHNSAAGGTRTHTEKILQLILSQLCKPIPAPRQAEGRGGNCTRVYFFCREAP